MICSRKISVDDESTNEFGIINSVFEKIFYAKVFLYFFVMLRNKRDLYSFHFHIALLRIMLNDSINLLFIESIEIIVYYMTNTL